MMASVGSPLVLALLLVASVCSSFGYAYSPLDATATAPQACGGLTGLNCMVPGEICELDGELFGRPGGVCVGQTCEKAADCPSSLVCGEEGKCQRCPGIMLHYACASCVESCQTLRVPVTCPAECQAGCRCPPESPILLDDGVTCGKATQCENLGGGAVNKRKCVKFVTKKKCRRHKKVCRWNAKRRRCVVDQDKAKQAEKKNNKK